MRVYRSSEWGDWVARCDEHDAATYTGAWAAAMESAWGHVAMHHPAPPCAHEYGWIDPKTNDHWCFGCGGALPTLPKFGGAFEVPC